MVIYYPKKNRTGTYILFGFLGTLFGLSTMLITFWDQAKASPLISPLADSFANSTFPPIWPHTNQSSELPIIVEQNLEGTTGSYAVVFKNLDTAETYVRNDHQVFEPASLYKLWVMGAMYQAIEQGKFTEDQVLSDSIPNLNAAFDIDPENAELTEGGITLSVTDALHQMITISHNYASLLLAKNLRLKTVQAYLDDHGFAESAVGEPPKTTAADIAFFLEKLYSGQLANQENTQNMLDLLTKQELNDKIPLYLPEQTKIAHKTGELAGFSHDAAIIYTPKGNYILVVLSESDIPAAAEKRIADISKAVYEYFLGQ